MGGRSISMSPSSLREETVFCELPISGHRGSAKEQEKDGAEVQRDAQRLWAETLKKPRNGVIAGGGVRQKLFA